MWCASAGFSHIYLASSRLISLYARMHYLKFLGKSPWQIENLK
ncbi:hypothetical protein J627_0979 [Acinetobacter sp. 1245593]|nr:hypothetical protein J627_0979 [Acinetobacter sp. 1245593]